MSRSPPQRPASTRALVGGASVVTALFVAITAYAGATFYSARRTAVDAATRVLPAMRSLVAARTDVRHLNTAMDELQLDQVMHAIPSSEALIAARRELGAHLDAWARVPSDAAERAQYHQALEALDGVDAASTTLRDLFTSGDVVAAARYEGGSWREHTDRLDEAIRQLLLTSGEHLEDRVERLERIAGRSLIIVSVGGVLSLMVAMLALWHAVRRIRAHEHHLEDRASELELFSARVAHDIMSPLQMVLLALNRAHERGADPLSARLTARGLDAVTRVRDIVDALLDFARAGGAPPDGQRASVAAVADVLLEELAPYADEHGVELRGDGLPAVEVACSGAMLYVMLSNLLRNAIKHLGERPVRRVTLRVVPDGDAVRFEVEDTGPGLPSGSEARVFDAFVRGQGAGGPGIGLGLATVKRTAEAHGGAVGVRSTPDQGALFWVSLPRAA